MARIFHRTFAGLVCGCAAIASAQAIAQEVSVPKRVEKIFDTTYGEDLCGGFLFEETRNAPEIFAISFNYADEDREPRRFSLFRFNCTLGAYNQGSVFYAVDEYDEIRQVQFAVPSFDVTYENGDYEGNVQAIDVRGFSTQDVLTNPEVDPETLTISSTSYWRGLADASSVAEWQFIEGTFVLNFYDIDPTYDGEIEHTRIFGEGQPDHEF